MTDRLATDSAPIGNPAPRPLPQYESARVEYQARFDAAREQLKLLATKHVKLVWLRTVCFVVALASFILGYGGDTYRGPLQVVAWLAAIVFLYAIVRHEHLRLQTLMHKSDERLFLRLLARLDRKWAELPETKLLGEFSGLTFADDLDVAGGASLLTLLSLTGTAPGNQTLQSWIANPPSWHEVKQRQASVRLLKDQRDLRLSIIKTVIATSDASGASDRQYGLPAWARSEAWLPRHRFAHALSYIGPALVVGGLVALLVANSSGEQAAGNMAVNAAAITLGLGFLINILVTISWGSWLHDIFLQVTGEHRAVYHMGEVFQAFSQLPRDDGLLSAVRHAAVESPTSRSAGFLAYYGSCD
ncbi:MAG: hypothetical protein R3C53_16545 [Pirellulaceae bacterium]